MAIDDRDQRETGDRAPTVKVLFLPILTQEVKVELCGTMSVGGWILFVKRFILSVKGLSARVLWRILISIQDLLDMLSGCLPNGGPKHPTLTSSDGHSPDSPHHHVALPSLPTHSVGTSEGSASCSSVPGVSSLFVSFSDAPSPATPAVQAPRIHESAEEPGLLRSLLANSLEGCDPRRRRVMVKPMTASSLTYARYNRGKMCENTVPLKSSLTKSRQTSERQRLSVYNPTQQWAVHAIIQRCCPRELESIHTSGGGLVFLPC